MPALSNAKHETFCQLVAKGETNTKASLSCGYSKQGAAQSARKLRKKPHIQQRLSELSVTAVRVIEQKFESDVSRIVKELCSIALCDPGEIMDDAGNVLPLKQMLPHVRAAISSVKIRTEVDKDGNVNHISEVRFWNKNSALEILAKYRPQRVVKRSSFNSRERQNSGPSNANLIAVIRSYFRFKLGNMSVLAVSGEST